MEDQIKHPDDEFTENQEQSIKKNDNAVFPLNSNDTLVAGFKARNKAGGPVVLIMGFIAEYPEGSNFSFEADKIRSTSQNYYTSHHQREIFPKVSYNRDKVPSIVYIDPEKKEVLNYWFFRSIHTDIADADKVSNIVFAVCKRWSDKEDDYVYSIIGLHELEIVNE